MSLLNLKNVKSEVEGKEILKGVDLTINKGEVHVIMGPNGAGKSTLASILVGHPKHEVVGGQILLEGEDITELEVDERAQKRGYSCHSSILKKYRDLLLKTF